ncbi:DUF1015 family protein [Kineococcus rhizosphaerae]|uniref:Uncharacterized protein (DUF1015 family) n=1 Tax=Kineococcus rhizosphaerae TaxID=559628 RepID=A0A2T0R9C8_9ACTN|nr:DUF1015 family protein [Kineococcus rhizosphaerae]PRY17769.1 uncharacterized protein (DUF1015 family) [Kineococcus rhizosphaerae]
MEAARTGARVLSLPSSTEDPVGTPLLRSFPGLRYSPDVAGPLWRLLAPPHTELDKARRAAFLASSPYVVTHLERPEYSVGPGDPDVVRWLDAGVLVQDPASLYVLRQHVAGRARHYLLGALDVSPGDTRVRPHEGVFDQAVTARLERLERTGVDSEPVLVVDSTPWPLPWTRPEGLGELVTRALDEQGAPLVEVWRLRDPEVVRTLVLASASHRFLIADGHHRYAAVHRAAVERGRPAELLVAVVDETVEPVDLSALHRVLPVPAAAAVLDQAERRRSVPSERAAVEEVLRGLGAEQALVLLPDRAAVVEGPEPSGPTVGSGAWVDALLRSGGVAAEAVKYQADTARVWDALSDRAAILLPRPTLGRLQTIVQSGRMLGRKTTSFRPKPLAGAVLRLR